MVLSENATNRIIADINAETLVDLHGYLSVAVAGISLFHFDYKADDLLRRTASA